MATGRTLRFAREFSRRSTTTASTCWLTNSLCPKQQCRGHPGHLHIASLRRELSSSASCGSRSKGFWNLTSCYSPTQSRRYESSTTGSIVDSKEKEEWTAIFQYPHIKTLRLFFRIKVYQTVGTLVITPAVVFAQKMQWIDIASDIAEPAFVLSVSASVVLLAVGYVAERIVGMMYVNADRSLLRVGHMNFWGSRHDHVFRTKDVAEFADIGEQWNNLYVKLHRYSAPNDPLYVSLKHGGIMDEKLFRDVFGNDLQRP